MSADLQPGHTPQDLHTPRPRNTTKQQAELTKALTEIPDAYTLLALFRLPGSRPPDPDRRIGTTSPARPPLNLDVLDLEDAREKRDAPATRDYQLDRMAGARRQGVLPTLSSWVRLIDGGMWDCGEEHTTPSEAPTVAGECVWLSQQLEWVVEQEWMGEFDNDIHLLLADIRRACGEREEESKHLSCMQCGWQVDEQDNGSWFRCSGCGRAWSRLELHRMAKWKSPQSLKAIAGELRVSERTLRRYRAKRLIRPSGRDGTLELYYLAEVRAAVRQAGDDITDIYRKQDA